METSVSQAVCEERHKALDNYLSNDKTKLLKHDAEIKDVQEAIVVLTEIQRRHNAEIDDHEDRLRGIEAKPGKRWESIVGQIIQLIIAAAIGGMIGKLF
ncbi:hypothetical protein Sgly_0362 [Syntrophobotulus glycolicus DSM 8271]|uniref:Uncharacterized protein n=1 Tax=Syntrophobotulus glycolicus (strain DSM 8271 / FlGlyR) TaxID=645991 RepID=F0SXI2_SYNGF|nr:hypothetical protein [Syntrophobotulus glycolicus]ADY54728.1 hypothetical protein Sgly_0362 [Syntrophobotulus glycolicus DSM 8271]